MAKKRINEKARVTSSWDDMNDKFDENRDRWGAVNEFGDDSEEHVEVYRQKRAAQAEKKLKPLKDETARLRALQIAATERKANEKLNAFELASKDLYNFRYLMLENNEKEEYEPAAFHFKWSDYLINGKDNIGILGFRGCGKSEYVLRAFPLYALAYPSEERDFIVILKYNDDQAKQVIKSIRKEYEASPLLKHNLVKINESSANIFEAEVRDADGKIHRVRIMGFGKGASIRGLRDVNRRPKIIIGDDLQDKKDFIGETVHETDWEWFDSDVRYLGSENSRIFMIGNNLGERCIMERIRRNKHLLDFDFEVVPQATGDWQPSWPSKDTREKVLKERDNAVAMGSIAYGRWLMEKMCEAVNDHTRIFTKDKFKYYVNGTEDGIMRKCKIYLLSDLASSTKKTSDYRVLLLLAVDQHNNWFIIDCPYGQWDTKEYMKRMFDLVETHNLDKVYMENGQILQSIRPFMREEMSKRGTFFRIEELKADRKKEERIALLQPRFESGSVYFPETAPWLGEMENELLSFTMEGAKSLHDDLMDTLAYGIKVAKPANPDVIKRKKQVRRSATYQTKQTKI